MFSCNYKQRATLPCIYDCHLTLLRKPSSFIDEWLPASAISRIQPRILLYLHAALKPIVRYKQTLIDTYRRYFKLLKYTQLFKSQLESRADLYDLWTCIRSQGNTSIITEIFVIWSWPSYGLKRKSPMEHVLQKRQTLKKTIQIQELNMFLNSSLIISLINQSINH